MKKKQSAKTPTLRSEPQRKKRNLCGVVVQLYERLCRWWEAVEKKRLHKFIQEQHSYQWELFDIETTGEDRSTQTFDFVSSMSFMSRVRIVFFVMMLGSFIGIASTVFQYCEFFSHHYFEDFEHFLSHSWGPYWIYFHWTIGAAASGLFCGYITKVYIPECSGAGADATKICMAVKAPVPLFVGFGRIILSSIYLGMGNPLGTEAPTLHVTAAVASSFLRAGSKLLPEDFRLEHLPTWVLVGMTAGLAAAFVAPLAGMLYAVEEFMNIRKIGLSVVPIGVASTCASLVSVTIRGQLDEHVHAERFHKRVLRVDFQPSVHLTLLAIFMAILCSAMALTFQKVTLKVRLFNNTVISRYIQPKFFGGVAGLVVGVIGGLTYVATHSHGSWSVGTHHYAMLLTEPSCEEEQATFYRYESISHPGEFYLIAQADAAARGDYTLAEATKCFHWYTHFFYFFGRSLMVIVAVSVGGPGGIFFPALLLGGSLGSGISGVFALLDPEGAHQYRVLVVLGMVGLFASLIRTPMTAVLVTYEMSGYGAIGLVPGLTFNMILTSVLCFLICEYVDHLDFVAKVMLQDGIDFHELFERGLSQVEETPANGGVPKAKSASYRILVEAASRADIEQTLADNVWMLRLASSYNVKGIHEHLLRGARVDMNWVHHRHSNTCMQICIENELQNAVRLILFKKADPEKASGNPPILPLLRACRKGLARASTALIAYGANPSRQDKTTLDYPISAAAASGNQELLLALIQGNASMNVTNKAGETPLVIAARNRHQHLVNILTAEAWKMKRDVIGAKLPKSEVTDKSSQSNKSTKNNVDARRHSSLKVHFPVAPTSASSSSSDSSFKSKMSSLSSNEDEEEALAEQRDKILSLGWFTEDVLVARKYEGFLKEIDKHIQPRSALGDDKLLKKLWRRLRDGSAVFQISDKCLIRHMSSIEIQLFASIGTTDHVLMEHACTEPDKYTYQYPHYVNENVEAHDDWKYALEEALMSLFSFTPAWQSDNLIDPSHMDVRTTTEEKTGSKSIKFTTIFYKHDISLEIANPVCQEVTEMRIGLPVGEQFIRNGTRYKWVPAAAADILTQQGSAGEKVPARKNSTVSKPPKEGAQPTSIFTHLMKL